MNHSEREKCWQCSRARAGDNAEQTVPKITRERWMCDCTLASELHTNAGSLSHCRDCNKQRVVDSPTLEVDTLPHRSWLVQRRLRSGKMETTWSFTLAAHTHQLHCLHT